MPTGWEGGVCTVTLTTTLHHHLLFVQVRQWQHWGSGCYEFTCSEEDGRLHLVVLNRTYTCFYPQQEIQISLEANG